MFTIIWNRTLSEFLILTLSACFTLSSMAETSSCPSSLNSSPFSFPLQLNFSYINLIQSASLLFSQQTKAYVLSHSAFCSCIHILCSLTRHLKQQQQQQPEKQPIRNKLYNWHRQHNPFSYSLLPSHPPSPSHHHHLHHHHHVFSVQNLLKRTNIMWCWEKKTLLQDDWVSVIFSPFCVCEELCWIPPACVWASLYY